ncbi:MAG TPA: sugar phosphate isomerase/epimerase family protein [Bacillota bacterium]|nr:sugar phosphate isomerase/epimerase family protein [Bacillota bacterium]
MAEKIISPEQPAAMGIHYHYYSLKYMLESQKRAGYQSIELFCAAPHVQMTAEGIGDRAEFIQTIRDSGLRVVCVTPDNCMGPWQYAAAGAEKIDQGKRYFRHALQLAADLDCRQVACHSGWGLLDEPREEAWKRSLDFMEWYCKEAKKLGLTLVMESLRSAESNLVNNLPTLEQYLKELDCDNIKPMIDTCAMAVAGESMEEWFHTFGSEIVHMHFVDGTPYFHLAWGDGDRSLDGYMAVIKANNYQGALTQEITDGRYYDDPAKADEQSYRILRGYMKD